MTEMSLGEKIAPHLAYVRRYARALTGGQMAGDALVRATLETIVAAPQDFPTNVSPRLGLYAMFERISAMTAPLSQEGAQGGTDATDLAMRHRLAALTPQARRALLLTSMEGFSHDDTAYLLSVAPETIGTLVREALNEIERQTRARVLIIEDEPVIAMDIQDIVEAAGHEVVAIAATRDSAIAEFQAHAPGLVLADIQLADQSSGIDAVNAMLAERSVPVIFITAFPERLLTGEKPEPAFLITKPFQSDAVAAAMAQALFFDMAAEAA